MKTKGIRKVLNELCKELNEVKQDNDYTYEVRELDETILAAREWLNGYDDYVAKVCKTDSDYSISITEHENLDSRAFQPYIKAIQDYSMTPLEERKDEQRWHIHLLEDSDKYLNLYKAPYMCKAPYKGCQDQYDKGHYLLSDKDESGSYQTKFTRSEIEDWAGTSNDEVVDWIIGKLGEEVE